jgi:hypothetical protein
MDFNAQAELDATTQAVIAADEALETEEDDRVQWERRGLLQRLARDERPG